MTLRDQINLELDDVCLCFMEKEINKIYPDLKLESDVPKDLENKISEILSGYAKKYN